jgi:3-deoxy-7-phosphoheptulonate synthase
MSLASVAAGADGVMVEVHRNPSEALCDGDQSLTPQMFTNMMKKLRYLQDCMDKINNIK